MFSIAFLVKFSQSSRRKSFGNGNVPLQSAGRYFEIEMCSCEAQEAILKRKCVPAKRSKTF